MADWRVNYSAQDVARIESEVGVAANYAGFDAAGISLPYGRTAHQTNRQHKQIQQAVALPPQRGHHHLPAAQTQAAVALPLQRGHHHLPAAQTQAAEVLPPRRGHHHLPAAQTLAAARLPGRQLIRQTRQLHH